jgi:hypothetical protein
MEHLWLPEASSPTMKQQLKWHPDTGLATCTSSGCQQLALLARTKVPIGSEPQYVTERLVTIKHRSARRCMDRHTRYTQLHDMSRVHFALTSVPERTAHAHSRSTYPPFMKPTCLNTGAFQPHINIHSSNCATLEVYLLFTACKHHTTVT